MLVRLGSFHCEFSLNSGQNFAVLVQYRVPGVGSFFEFCTSLVLENVGDDMQKPAALSGNLSSQYSFCEKKKKKQKTKANPCKATR